jgi:hypothetical protein
MPFLELIDETFDINSSENYELSLELSPYGFSYCILDTIRNKYILLRKTDPDDNKLLTPEKAGEIIGNDTFLAGKFKKVNLILPSSKSTLVPAPLFDPAKKEEYFTLNLIKEDNDIILYNKIPEPDAYVVFSVTRSFSELGAKLFPGLMPYHHITPLLHQVSHFSRNEFGLYVQVHLEKEYFNLLILEHGTLKFFNTFIYKNITDILYYVFNICKNMGISREETINFSGLTQKYDDLFTKTSRYIKNIKFTVPEGNFSFSYVFNETELHRNLNLFSVTNCE